MEAAVVEEKVAAYVSHKKSGFKMVMCYTRVPLIEKLTMLQTVSEHATFYSLGIFIFLIAQKCFLQFT